MSQNPNQPNPAQQADAGILAMYVKQHGSDAGWTGIEGSYFISGVQAARDAARELTAAQGGGHCQNGRGDVCRASQRDGIVCPADSCDIDDGTRKPTTLSQPTEPQENDMTTNEQAEMLSLANRIVANAHPEEDGRLEVAYAIARHLGLDWPSAYDRTTEPQGAVVDIPGEIGARIEILHRICKRGRTYFLEKEDSAGIDLFEHMATELGWLEAALPVAVGAGEDSEMAEKARRADAWDESCGDRIKREKNKVRRWALICLRDEVDAAMTPATPAGKGTP